MNTRAVSAARQAAMHNDCTLLDRHQWHETFIQGEFLCTRCGIKSFCPDCLSIVFPVKGARLHLCEPHRAQREAHLLPLQPPHPKEGQP